MSLDGNRAAGFLDFLLQLLGVQIADGREFDILERPLTQAEAYEVRNMARRIAAILLLSPALDANYRAAKQATSGLTKAAEV